MRTAASRLASPLHRVGRIETYAPRPHDGEAIDYSDTIAVDGPGLTPSQGFPRGPLGRLSESARAHYHVAVALSRILGDSPREVVAPADASRTVSHMGPPLASGVAMAVPSASALRRAHAAEQAGRLGALSAWLASHTLHPAPSLDAMRRNAALGRSHTRLAQAADAVVSHVATQSAPARTTPGETLTQHARPARPSARDLESVLRAQRKAARASVERQRARMEAMGIPRVDTSKLDLSAKVRPSYKRPPKVVVQSTRMSAPVWPDRGGTRRPDKRPVTLRENPKPLSAAAEQAKEARLARRLEWLSMSDTQRLATILRRRAEKVGKARGIAVKGPSDYADGVTPAWCGAHSVMERAKAGLHFVRTEGARFALSLGRLDESALSRFTLRRRRRGRPARR